VVIESANHRFLDELPSQPKEPGEFLVNNFFHLLKVQIEKKLKSFRIKVSD
jgi:hypothetical protein